MADAGAAEARGAFGAGLEDDLARAALALARRFAAGATLWCAAPTWPEHARHVAVEFVHPVIMGTRALPAVSVVDPDLVPVLRSTMRPGDLLLAVSTADDPTVQSAMRRAGAWGVTTVWIGAGPRPQPGAADHVLWIDGASAAPAHDGSIVRLYHLLWELTHVCFEHPGLLTIEQDGPLCDPVPGCITCSDEGRVAEVLEAGADTAEVRTAGGSETVDTIAVGEVRAGDLLLVHAGTAIAVLERTGAGA
jgi:hydrogenase maturation factor